jgi:hypothetical protein
MVSFAPGKRAGAKTGGGMWPNDNMTLREAIEGFVFLAIVFGIFYLFLCAVGDMPPSVTR